MKKKEKYTINEHYIPNSLLELFRDDDGKFYYFNKQDKKIRNGRTSRACFVEDLYETTMHNSEKIYLLRNEIENALSNKENNYIALVKKIISICSNPANKYALILHTKEIPLLMEFIANLHLRNPDRLSFYMGNVPISEEGQKLEEEVKSVKKHNFEENDILTMCEKAFETVRLKATVLNESGNSWIEYFKRIMLDGRFCFIKSTNGDFITSDNIAGVSSDDYIYLPLNCYYAVSVSLDKDGIKRVCHNRLCSCNDDAIDMINQLVYQEAKKYVYGKKETLTRFRQSNIISK